MSNPIPTKIQNTVIHSIYCGLRVLQKMENRTCIQKHGLRQSLRRLSWERDFGVDTKNKLATGRSEPVTLDFI